MALQKILSRKRKDVGRRKQARTKGAECLSHSTVLCGGGKEEGHPLSTGGVQRLPLGLESALISVCTLSNQGKSFNHKDGTFVYPHLPYFKILEALICLFLSSKSVFLSTCSHLFCDDPLKDPDQWKTNYNFFIQYIVVSKSKCWDWWKTNGKKINPVLFIRIKMMR